MFKLLSSLTAPNAGTGAWEPRERLTRFPHCHVREQAMPEEIAPQAVGRVAEASTVRSQRDAPAASRPAPQVSEIEHLHSEAKISAALLKRALPIRFAGIDAQFKNDNREALKELRMAFN